MPQRPARLLKPGLVLCFGCAWGRSYFLQPLSVFESIPGRPAEVSDTVADVMAVRCHMKANLARRKSELCTMTSATTTPNVIRLAQLEKNIKGNRSMNAAKSGVEQATRVLH